MERHLAVEGLTKSYRGRHVVRQVNLDIRPAEVVGLLGPNGAGKTTTFYCILGLVAQEDSGVVVESCARHHDADGFRAAGHAGRRDSSEVESRGLGRQRDSARVSLVDLVIVEPWYGLDEDKSVISSFVIILIKYVPYGNVICSDLLKNFLNYNLYHFLHKPVHLMNI